MTGPHMLAKVAYDDYYNDIGTMMADIGKLLHHNFRMLAAAGCKHIQIDEPLFTMSDDDEIAGRHRRDQHRDRGTAREVHVSVHICQGNYAVGRNTTAQIGHRYFDPAATRPTVCKIECSSFLVEYDMAHHYEGRLGNRQLGVGAVDVQDPKVETAETVAGRDQGLWVARARTDASSPVPAA